jgi:hypothetical protein
MSTPYVFGTDFNFKLFLYQDKTKITSIPAQTINAHIFKDSPSRSSAASGVGALQSKTQVLATGSEPISIAFDALVDDDYAGSLDYRLYYVCINLRLKAAAQIQTIIRAIKVERVSGQDIEIGVTLENIKGIYPDVNEYLSDPELQTMLDLAKIDLVEDLSSKGFDWNQIYSPDQLFNALLQNVLVSVYNSQINRDVDKFTRLADKAQARYEIIKGNLKLAYDATGAGSQTETRKAGGLILAVR